MLKFQQYLNENFPDGLKAAVGRSGVDFYFEEGGCWGMALALARMFKKQGKACYFCVTKSYFIHAFVECEGKFYDSDGEYQPTTTYKRTGTDEEGLFKMAEKHGVNRNKVEADATQATDIIDGCLEG